MAAIKIKQMFIQIPFLKTKQTIDLITSLCLDWLYNLKLNWDNQFRGDLHQSPVGVVHYSCRDEGKKLVVRNIKAEKSIIERILYILQIQQHVMAFFISNHQFIILLCHCLPSPLRVIMITYTKVNHTLIWCARIVLLKNKNISSFCLTKQ